MYKRWTKYLLGISALGLLGFFSTIVYLHGIENQMLVSLGAFAVLLLMLIIAVKFERSLENTPVESFEPSSLEQIIYEGNHLLDLVANYLQQREQALLLLQTLDKEEYFEQQRNALALYCRSQAQPILAWWIQPVDRYKHFVTPAQGELATIVALSWAALIGLLDLPSSNNMVLPDMEDFLELTTTVAEEVEHLTSWPGITPANAKTRPSDEPI